MPDERDRPLGSCHCEQPATFQIRCFKKDENPAEAVQSVWSWAVCDGHMAEGARKLIEQYGRADYQYTVRGPV